MIHHLLWMLNELALRFGDCDQNLASTSCKRSSARRPTPGSMLTIVEEEADFSSTREDFVQCFKECLRFYTVYFGTLEESFPMTSN
ncbi:hypothetical protein MLD38_010696 [Melastoma candidum]|uniref:Uncharacterized protein n=1 Tax=Melastoma candidum TaxID=119954 RepID=A0ACB9R466_9MYRT|nr:hypothetical protein MLD38_010696 [Melastoma candidum]